MSFLRIVVRERYGVVLAFILGGYVLAGFDTNRIVAIINVFIWASVLLMTLWTPALPSKLRHIGLGATLLVVVSAVTLGIQGSDPALGVRYVLLSVAQAAALVAILFRILHHARVTIQTVMGGVAAYALIAFVFAAVFQAADLLTDSTFLNNVVDAGDYTYFSFVTLTTVGYGDITAASDVAKRLVVVEAFVGQVFIITFVARLVSLWGQPLDGNA